MPSPTLNRFLLIAALPLYATLHDASAAQATEASMATPSAQALPAPDEARIAADLKHHALLASLSALGATPDSDARAHHTSIRSSVRDGEVLEYRVTSLYYPKTEGEAQREVDAIVRYQLQGNQWSLLGVQNEATRSVIPGDTDGAAAPC